jgi:hypothetical protein
MQTIQAEDMLIQWAQHPTTSTEWWIDEIRQWLDPLQYFHGIQKKPDVSGGPSGFINWLPGNKPGAVYIRVGCQTGCYATRTTPKSFPYATKCLEEGKM